MTDDTLAWVAPGGATDFGVHRDSDELYHGDGPAGDSLTETWYWGFNVPEARINCYVYCWVHPNLGVVSAGLMIYQGVKRNHIGAELFDMPMFLSLDVVGDGRAITVPNGLTMTVVEPLKHIEMRFADAARDTEVEVDLRAVDAPVVRANGKHFEQVMRTTGRLRLRGSEYAVDSYNIRDRSWGELRPESAVPSPPYNWVTGVFDAGRVAFNVGSLDDPEHDPHWLAQFPVPAAAAFKDGWISFDGEPRRIVHASKRVVRLASSLRPTRIEIEMRDSTGAEHVITGEVVAGLPWGGWHNITCHLALVRWEMAGQIGWGDSMDVQWNDYVWRFQRPEAELLR